MTNLALQALASNMPRDVTFTISSFLSRDRNESGATFAAIASFTFSEVPQDPEGILVYSVLGNSFRIPVAHQVWRTELVYDHVFRFMPTLRDRGWM